GARQLRLDGAPAAVGEMGAQASAQVHRFPDIERAAGGVLQHVDAGDSRCVAADALTRAAPGLAAILEDERLRDQPPGELGRRAADPEDLGGEALMVGRSAHLGEPCNQPVAKHGSFCIPSPNSGTDSGTDSGTYLAGRSRPW